MRWLNKITHQTVIVHLENGQSLRGVLTGVFSDCIVMMHARYLSGDNELTVDGEVVVPRPNVGWLQVINAKDEA